MSDGYVAGECGLVDLLGIEFEEKGPQRVTGHMPITDAVKQPFGFLHGGATISLLESLASLGGELSADMQAQRPFGVMVNIRHCKSGVSGLLHGEATLERTEPHAKSGGVKQYWKTTATDDAGDIISTGEIMIMVVPIAYLDARAESSKKGE